MQVGVGVRVWSTMEMKIEYESGSGRREQRPARDGYRLPYPTWQAWVPPPGPPPEPLPEPLHYRERVPHHCTNPVCRYVPLRATRSFFFSRLTSTASIARSSTAEKGAPRRRLELHLDTREIALTSLTIAK